MVLWWIILFVFTFKRISFTTSFIICPFPRSLSWYMVDILLNEKSKNAIHLNPPYYHLPNAITSTKFLPWSNQGPPQMQPSWIILIVTHTCKYRVICALMFV